MNKSTESFEENTYHVANFLSKKGVNDTLSLNEFYSQKEEPSNTTPTALKNCIEEKLKDMK